MIWLGLAVYQTDINCRAYKNCRQSQIFFKKNVAKLLTTKEFVSKNKKLLTKPMQYVIKITESLVVDRMKLLKK